MNTHSTLALRVARPAALLLGLFLLGGAAVAKVDLDTDCTPKLAGVDQRLYRMAGMSPDVLRNFMWVRRGILQLDIYETKTWAAEIDDDRARCLKAHPHAANAVEGSTGN